MRGLRRRDGRAGAGPALAVALALAGPWLAACGSDDQQDTGAPPPERTLVVRSHAGTVQADFLGGCDQRPGAGVCPMIALRPAGTRPLDVRPGETLVVEGDPPPTALDVPYAVARSARVLDQLEDEAEARRDAGRWLVELDRRLGRADHLVLRTRYGDGDGTFVLRLRTTDGGGRTGDGGNDEDEQVRGDACAGEPGAELDALVDKAVRVRSRFGFRADRAYVRELITDPPPGVSCAQLAVPLTPAERRHLLERQRDADEAIPIVRRYAREHAPETFAGLWIDHRQGGLLRVAFTSDVVEHRRALRERVPSPDRLAVGRARFSQAELTKVKDRISADLDELRREGLDVRTVGVDIPGNRVSVGMANPSEARARELRERYGPMVAVEPGRVVPVPRTAPRGR